MKWEYGTLNYWRERPELVAEGSTMVFKSMPFEWPWRGRWRHKGTVVTYDELNAEKDILNELGAEGWEIVDRQVERVSYSAVSARLSKMTYGSGFPLHQTVDVTVYILMKRPVEAVT